jgi:hypothetical protein
MVMGLKGGSATYAHIIPHSSTMINKRIQIPNGCSSNNDTFVTPAQFESLPASTRNHEMNLIAVEEWS